MAVAVAVAVEEEAVVVGVVDSGAVGATQWTTREQHGQGCHVDDSLRKQLTWGRRGERGGKRVGRGDWGVQGAEVSGGDKGGLR